jgi:hypothetical protein
VISPEMSVSSIAISVLDGSVLLTSDPARRLRPAKQPMFALTSLRVRPYTGRTRGHHLTLPLSPVLAMVEVSLLSPKKALG